MTVVDTVATARPAQPRTTVHAGIPLTRIAITELRKMFDTRSGLWLMVSIAISALLASVAVIGFAPQQELTYGAFITAIGIPMTLVLPIIAILAVTGEWSQRSGLTTFTLIPHRGRVITAKAIACLAVGVVTIPLAFGVGALGNLAGATAAGIDPVWDRILTNLLTLVLANVLSLLVGFMLGVLIRASTGALVAYFIYQFLLPSLALLLATRQEWFRDVQPWVDFDYAQSALFEASMTSQQWTQLATTGVIWLVLPLTLGLALVTRAEVK